MSDHRGFGARAARHVPAWFGVLVLATILATPATPASAQKFQTAQEAYQLGIAFFPFRQYDKARPPLEQALKMAQDDPMRLKVYSALLSVYISAAETGKAIEAMNFIVAKDPSIPSRSMARRAFMNFAATQGKVDDIIDRYEDRLKKDANDKSALYILSEIYARLRPNPERSGELLDRLAQVMKESGEEITPIFSATRAEQYVKAGRFKEGAEAFEQIAARDADLSAWHHKEAAQAYLKAGDKVKALAAARAADAAPPEKRGDLLLYFWDRALGDVYLQTGVPGAAVTHYEKALATTKIAGYADDTKKMLAEARAAAHSSGVVPPPTTTEAPSARPVTARAVDLNRASIAQLMAIDGITEDLAIEIAQHRKKKPFESISELIELEGVDKALLSKIRPALTVGPAK